MALGTSSDHITIKYVPHHFLFYSNWNRRILDSWDLSNGILYRNVCNYATLQFEISEGNILFDWTGSKCEFAISVALKVNNVAECGLNLTGLG
jgi:hypothetical protein